MHARSTCRQALHCFSKVLGSAIEARTDADLNCNMYSHQGACTTAALMAFILAFSDNAADMKAMRAAVVQHLACEHVQPSLWMRRQRHWLSNVQGAALGAWSKPCSPHCGGGDRGIGAAMCKVQPWEHRATHATLGQLSGAIPSLQASAHESGRLQFLFCE